MKTKREPRNLKVLNAVALLCIMGYLAIHAYDLYFRGNYYNDCSLSVIYIDIALEIVSLLFVVFAVVLNFIHKYGSDKTTVISLYLPLIMRGICFYAYYHSIDNRHFWLTESHLRLLGMTIVPVILYLLTVIVIIHYLTKPSKSKLIVSNVLLVMSAVGNFLVNSHAIYNILSDEEMIITYIILVFALLILNLAYKNIKIVETESPNMNVKQANNINSDLPETIKQYKALLDEGIITQDEYEKKKKELLEL